MKRILSLVILISFISIIFSGTLEITHVNYTGFEADVQTTLSVAIAVDDFTQQESCRLWITPDDSTNWYSGYYNNGTSNYLEFIVDSSHNGTIVSRDLNITPITSASQSLQELIVKTSIGDDSPSDKEKYDLKVVIDKPFNISNFDENDQLILAEKFLPILRMDDGSQIENDYFLTDVGPELYLPQEIDVLINGSEIWNREGVNEYVSNASKELLTQNCEKTNYIKFHAGEEPGEINDWYQIHHDEFNIQLYASFFEQENNVYLTYWFFYLFNNNEGWAGAGFDTDFHIGEWEGMNIVFNKTDIQNNYNTAIPIKAATSSHTSGDCGKRRESWNNIEKIDHHPIVYVCNGSHATYFHRGKSDNQAPWPGPYEVDYHYGNGNWIIPQDINIMEINDFCNIYNYQFTSLIYYGNIETEIQVELLPRLNSMTNSADYWHSFGGNWGQSQLLNRIELLSPSGPPYIESVWNGSSWPYSTDEHNDGYKWFRPYEWCEDQELDPNLSLIVDFTVSDMTGNVPLEINFSDQSSELATSWLWDFGDGDTSTQQSPNHTYTTSGTYSVSLTISDGTNSITKTETNLITVFGVAEPTLSNGYVTPNPGNSGDNYEFYVTYTDPTGYTPSNVELHLTTQTYNMNHISGNVATGALYKYERTISNTGTFLYHFEANSGQQRFPETVGEFLSLSINQSAVGWDIRITEIDVSPNTMQSGGDVDVDFRIHNNSSHYSYIYNNVPYEIYLYSPTGNLIDLDSGTTGTIGQGQYEWVDGIVTVPSTNGLYTVTATIFPDLDENFSDNSMSTSVYVGDTGDMLKYLVPQSHEVVIWETGDSNQITFNGLNYYIHTVTDDYCRISTNNNVYDSQIIYEDDYELFSNDNTMIINQYCNHSSTYGDELFLSFGARYYGSSYNIDIPYVSGFQGETISIHAHSNSNEFYERNPDFYNTPVSDWYSHYQTQNSNQDHYSYFNIPGNQSPGNYTFYLDLEIDSPGSYSEHLIQRCRITVLATSPNINSISQTTFSADDEITISGSNLGTSGSLYFGSLLCPTNDIISWSNTSISCIVPEGVQNGSLYLVNSVGTSNALGYQIISSTGDPELIQPIPDQSMMAGTSQLITDLANNFWDPNNDDLFYAINYSSSYLTYNADSLLIDKLFMTVEDNIEEDITISVTATDADNASIEDIFILTIQDINNPPSIGPIPDQTFNEDESLTLDYDYFNTYVTDPDNNFEELILDIVNYGNLIVQDTGTQFIISAPTDWFGEDSMTLFVHDGEFTVSQSINVIVNPVADPPENVFISIVGNDIHISWEAVMEASSYKVYSSNEPYSGFTEDTSGTFDAESWSTVNNDKSFFYVTAIDGYNGSQGKIVFVSNRSGNNDVFLMDEDGNNQLNLTNNSSNDKVPSISPTKSHIAFSSDRNGSNDVYIMNLNGSDIVQLTFNVSTESIYGTDWLDNDTIIFGAKSGGVYYLYSIDIDGNNLQIITDSNLDATNPDVNSSFTKIYMRRNTPYNAYTSKIYSCNIVGSDMTALTGTIFSDPADIIVNDIEKVLCHHHTNKQIYIMNSDGSDMVNLSNNTYNETSTHSDIPNTFVFTSDRSGENNIWKMNYDGSNIIQLTSEGSNYSSFWRH